VLLAGGQNQDGAQLGQWKVKAHFCGGSAMIYLAKSHDLAQHGGRSFAAALSHDPAQGVMLTLTLTDTPTLTDTLNQLLLLHRQHNSRKC
jgi:hypothetical protein